MGMSKLSPHTETKDSGIEWLGQIPAHWEARRLKCLATINDEALGEDTDPDYEISYIDIGNVDATKGILEKESYRFEDAPSRARRVVHHGDVIVSTVRTYLRAIAPIVDREPNLIVSTGFAVIRPWWSLCSGFASYMLRAPYLVDRVVAESVGVSYPAISAWQLGTFRVAVPGKDEQQAIADFLDRETAKIDALVEKKERLIELLQEKRTALITQAVTKGLPAAAAAQAGLDSNVPMKDSGIEWLGQIPAHWGFRKMKYSGRLLGGGTPSKSVQGYWDGSVPWVSPKDMHTSQVLDTEDHITEQAVRESATEMVPTGSMLMVVRSGILRHTIPVAVNQCDVALNQDMKALVAHEEDVVRYFMYVIEGKQQELLAEWRSEGATVQSLRFEWVSCCVFPYPPQVERRAIADYLDRETAKIGTLIAKIQEAIERLKEYRTALISAAVTGKIDVREETA